MTIQEVETILLSWISETKNLRVHSTEKKDFSSNCYLERKERALVLVINTDRNCYRVVATTQMLGVYAIHNEDRTQMFDLTHGSFSKDTWTRILAEILGYELARAIHENPQGSTS